MRKILIAYIVVAFSTVHSYAQSSMDEYEDEETYDQVEADSSEAQSWLQPFNTQTDTTVHIHLITISKDSLDAWQADKRYKPIKNLDSLLRDWQNKEQAKSQKEMKGISFLAKILSSNLLGTILWILGISLVIYIIWQVIGNQGFFTRSQRKEAVEVPETPDEQYLNKDFDALLFEAKQTGNYRLASRYLFLKLLSYLNEKSLIQFGIDKTNVIYLKELPDVYKSAFRKVATYYEYGWYGSNALSAEQFAQMEEAVKNFIKR